MEKYQLGFNMSELPVVLTENTSPNDVCPSFYFRHGGAYYLLWAEHQCPEHREDELSPRYAIIAAINYGDDQEPEIYSDTSTSDVFRSESTKDLLAYFSALTSP